MTVSIQVPSGYKLVHKTSSKFPKETWHSIERISTNRVWWKFWLPKFLYNYTVIEKIPESYWECN